MIRLRDVTFSYPGAAEPALERIGLEVGEADFLLVAGPSGSGKSTLLRVPSRLVPRHSGGRFSGRVEVGGRDVTAAPPRELAGLVGFVPQDPEAHAVADRVLPEIAFALENLGTPPAVMRKRIEEVLDQLGLAHLRERRLDTLSGGERQRVAIAAVLAAQPRVLVLDEPTSSLDPGSAEDVLSVLVRLRDELGLTVLCSEHRLERLAGFCDRACYLDPNGGGASVIEGDPRTVFARAPFAPPVTSLGKALGWEPLPLTVREGRRFAGGLSLQPPPVAAPSRGEPVLCREGVRAIVGGNEVLKGVDLCLHRGEIAALVGRNGAGKTTLLRALAGLLPDQARRRGQKRPAEGTRIVYVPQRAEILLFRESVRAELEASGGEVEARLRRLGLEEVADRHPWSLSAGQRLWCALGIALGSGADVLLLDEPTRGLDPPGRDRLARLLREEADRGGAVLLVTHDVELVARASDRLLLMAEGELVADGGVREILGESLLFSSQTSKVMADPRFLVPEDVLAGTRA